MRHLDEGTIHTWLDGALSSEDAARVEAHVADCSACATAVAEARGLIAASTRILTALDDVPNVRGARGAKGAKGAKGALRPFRVTWLVGERIAAVLAFVAVGGALAVAVSRDAPELTRPQMTSEPVQAFELAAADSPTPPPAMPETRKAGQAVGRVGGRVQPEPSRERDLAAALTVDTVPVAQPLPEQAAVTTQAVAAAPARTDDTARSVVIAQADREAVVQPSAEGKSSIGEKLAGALPRRQAADASARFVEPRSEAQGYAGAVTTGVGAADPRLVQEERMTEEGREVHRRIYRIDGILVTLDERLPSASERFRRVRPEANAAAPAPAAPAPAARADSAHELTNTIRWTDARGAELTLTGPASETRLERIRKLLGYE